MRPGPRATRYHGPRCISHAPTELAVLDANLDLVVRRETLLDDVAALQVLELNLPVSAQVAAGLLVAIEDHPHFAIVHDGFADLDIPHFHHGHGPAPLTVRKGDRTRVLSPFR